MKISKNIKLSIRIILFFIVAMCFSLIPDYVRTFFGDEYCSGWFMSPKTHTLEKFFHYGNIHETPQWHWGYRHWLFFMMGLSLATIQIIDIIMFINKKEK